MSELVDPASGIDKALFTSEERVACGTNTDTDVLDGGEGVVDGSAGAGNRRLVRGRMEVSFHDVLGLRRNPQAGWLFGPGA